MSQSASVLIVEDDPDLREALTDTLVLAGYDTKSVANGEDALRQIRTINPGMIVSDIQMSGMSGHQLLSQIRQQYGSLPVIMMTAYGNIHSAVKAMQEGADDYLEKPFSTDVLVDIVKKYLSSVSVSRTNRVIIEDEKSKVLYDLAYKVAHSDVSVMLTGESGTGKEVMAKYIHFHSARSSGPFVAINCAAIPENMLEATLFGYEKGAFTGAHQASPGKFELAQNGTLLLDEITEMDLALQAKLLRVIQEKEVERIGGRKTIPLDVRLIATSNRQLLTEVDAGHFREDLYYRLNVFPLHCLPLNQRIADIIPLAEHMLSKHYQGEKNKMPVFSNTARQLLKSYSWPGNVRELENVIQRSMILQSGEYIEAKDLQLNQIKESAAKECRQASVDVMDAHLHQNIKSHEHTIIFDALRKYDGSRKRTSEALGISPRTLRYKIAKMKELGIEVPN